VRFCIAEKFNYAQTLYN
jgi:hypothetical protein